MFTWCLYDKISQILMRRVSWCLVAEYTIWTGLCWFTSHQHSKNHHHRTVQIVHAATKQQLPCSIKHLIGTVIQQRLLKHFNLLLSLSCNFNNLNNFFTLASTRLILPEDDADASKHVGVLAIYTKYYLIYFVYLLVWTIKRLIPKLKWAIHWHTICSKFGIFHSKDSVLADPGSRVV